MIYGNWKESGRDSEERWKKLNFGDRIQTSQMRDIYSDSIATILLAKQEYCDHGFMTARLVEAILYGTVPLFIEEYGRGLIQTFAGMYAESLTVRSKKDVKVLVGTLKSNVLIRERIIKYLRMHLRFMDCKFFVNDVKSLIKE